MLRAVFVVADALLLLAFAGAYLARHVHPDGLWQLQLLGIGLPYLSAAVVLAGVVAFRLRQPVLLGLHGIAIVLILIRFIPAPGVETAAATGGDEELTVLSFNGKTSLAPASAGESFAALLDERRPQIVALQQVGVRFGYTGNGWDGDELYIPSLLGRGYEPAPVSVLRRQPRLELRLPVFTTLPWEEYEEINIRTDPRHERDGRTHLRAQLNLAGQSVAVYNVHLHSFGEDRPWKSRAWRERLGPRSWLEAVRSYRDDFRIRAAQAETLRRIVEEETMPFLLVGDFNSTPHNWEYHHLTRDLIDVFAARPRGWGGTYHARLPVFRIDHIIASPHWQVVRAEVLSQPRSDHRPVISSVRLRPTD